MLRSFPLVPVALFALSCTHHEPAGAPDAAPVTAVTPSASAVPAAPAASSAEADTDKIKPVYPADAGAPDPLAVRFCEAIDRTPDQRKSQCCASTPSFTSTALTGQCVRTLTAALNSHAVTLAEAAVNQCVDAMTRATAGCDWIAASNESNPLPSECVGIIHGLLPEKARCRSSLECTDTLRCQGLSTIDVGTCGRPKAATASCALANDMLATFARQVPLDVTHPECAGYCRVRQCKDAVVVGGACKGDAECGAQGRCEKGACTKAPRPALGQPCTASCAGDAKCENGVCTAPKAEGASCDADVECRGSCVHENGAAAGSCTKSCPKVRPLRK